jgi:kynurenine formamidase
MFERRKFWEAHRVMREREYYHLENLCNLDEIPFPYHSFTVSVLPVKWRGASAAPVRAVAILDDLFHRGGAESQRIQENRVKT